MTDHSGSTIRPVFQVRAGSPPAPTGQQACPKLDGVKVATENPVYSPQGDAFAYDASGPNSQNLFTYDIDMSDGVGIMRTATDLTPNYATDEAPSWSPEVPGTSTPEAPQSVLLPVAGGGVFGAAGLLVTRRRRKMLGAGTRSAAHRVPVR
jgi:hypothetical protein